MEFLIILAIIAFATGKVAQSKGRNFISWLFIGLLTGGFGLIAAFFLEPIEKKS